MDILEAIKQAEKGKIMYVWDSKNDRELLRIKIDDGILYIMTDNQCWIAATDFKEAMCGWC